MLTRASELGQSASSPKRPRRAPRVALVLAAAAVAAALVLAGVGGGRSGPASIARHAIPSVGRSGSSTPTGAAVEHNLGAKAVIPEGPWVPLPSFIWSVQDWFYNSTGAPLTQQDFDRFAADQYNTVEITVPWILETSPGVYNFTLLDKYMGYAENARLAVVVIFWYYGLAFNVSNWIPPWITSREVYSNGVEASYPPWWNASARSDYFAFINATVENLNPDPDFQGVYINFGWLDYMWGPPPSGSTGTVVAGYSNDTVRAYDQYLSNQYGTLAYYNSVYGTSYTSWYQIPAPMPGPTGEWNDFGNFRIWSVQQTYGLISEYVRAATNRTIFYYWGGDVAGAVNGVNLPDLFFALASQYGGIVNVDDADYQMFVDLFASLAARYHVRYIEEFTPQGTTFSEFANAFNETMANIYIGRPWEVGADYFTYNPTNPSFVWGLGAFGSLKTIAAAGTASLSPSSTTAALLSYYPGFYNFSSPVLYDEQLKLSTMAFSGRPFSIVTDRELMNGAVNLTDFSTVLDLGNVYQSTSVDPYVQGDLQWFVDHGGDLVNSAQSISYFLSEPSVVNVSLSPTPTQWQIDVQGTYSDVEPELFLSMCDWNLSSNSATAESGSVEVDLSGWGLPASGSFLVNDLLLNTHSTVESNDGNLSIPWSPVAGELDYFQIVPASPTPTIDSFVASPDNFTLGGSVILSTAASGGTVPYAYSFSGLPEGCPSEDAPSLVCTPAAAGDFTITVTLTDGAGRQATASSSFAVNPLPAVASFSATPNPMTQDSTVSFTAMVTGGTPPYSFVYTGLPTGCESPDASAFSCVPSTAGNYSAELTVTDTDGIHASGSARLVVNPLPEIVSFTVAPATVRVGAPLEISVNTSGGTPPLSYLYSGLPAGCSTSDSYRLECTPDAVGNYTVSVTVTDASQKVVNASLRLRVNPASPSPLFGTSTWLWILVGAGAALAGGGILGFTLRRRRRVRALQPPRGPSPSPSQRNEFGHVRSARIWSCADSLTFGSQ